MPKRGAPHHAPRVLLGLLVVAGCARTAASEREPGTLRAASDVSAAVAPSGVLRIATPRAEQAYLRCGTRAGEDTWTSWISPDAQRVAARTNTGTVRLLATDGWVEIAELASSVGRIEAAAFSPDGALLATSSQGAGQLAVWRAADGTLLRTYDVRPPSLDLTFFGALTFSPDGRQVVSPLRTITDLTTGETRDWEPAEDPRTHSAYDPGAPGPMQWVQGGDHVLAYREFWSHGASVVAELGWTRLSTGEVTLVLRGQPAHTRATFASSPDGRRIALAVANDSLRLYTLEQPEPLAGGTGDIAVLAFSADGSELYLRVGDALEVRDGTTLARLRSLPWPADSSFVALAPDGALVVSSAVESTWWSTRTGARTRTLPHALTRAHWSADGAYGVGETARARMVAWQEADAALLRVVPRTPAPLPTLAWNGAHVPLTNEFPTALRAVGAGHWQGTDWYRIEVLDRATGTLLRALPLRNEVFAELEGQGARLLTLEEDHSRVIPGGPYVAIWCREPPSGNSVL